jgi:cell division control protein 6
MAGTADDIFGTGGIFEKRELVQVGHVPPLERVVGRDREIKAVGGALGPATQGDPPETTIIYGKTGTGKSLVTRCVTREAVTRANRNDVTFQFAYVDCSDYQTEAKASREMARELADSVDDQTHNIPRVGIGATDYRDITWELLDEHNVDAFVVILDEIDKLDDEELLRSLSRAKESGKADTFIGVTCISNKIEYRERLNQRVDSSLQDNELVFDPYDANQLEDILQNRMDAFADGVVESGVVQKTAALAAREHGDARKAVETFYEAGRLAEKENASTVTVDHVDEAIEQAEVNRFQRLVRGQTPHAKYLLFALAALTKQQPSSRFRTVDVYEMYEQIAEREAGDPLSYDRAFRLLKEQAFLGITENERTGGGPGEGTYLEHRLMRDADVVIDALQL